MKKQHDPVSFMSSRCVCLVSDLPNRKKYRKGITIMKNIDMMQLTARLAADMPELGLEWAGMTAARLERDLDERLEVNVQEWLDRRPMTEVSAHASDGRIFSVPRLMTNGCEFLIALDCMNNLLHGNEGMALAMIDCRLR